MGQYHVLVNFDKKEFVHPHSLGNGLELAEQLYAKYGMKDALFILLASKSNGRGGGDLDKHVVVGRWNGDRVGLIGDYTENDDLPQFTDAKNIYGACAGDGSLGWKDITPQVAKYLEKAFDIKFTGLGWKDTIEKTHDEGGAEIMFNVPPVMKPDMIITTKEPRNVTRKKEARAK